ncbi:MAG: cytochrome-c oxidase, cbb3-type subunit III [Rhodospirillales bacterium]|nr:cytochrome-c oxidase, cbb3-type subunit III [Rhodospirillales bacterium]
MANKDVDALTGIETTGHEWDGIKELNNPLPKWWLYVFYVCIAYAMVYSVFYPSWPWFHGYVKGVLGYSTRAEFKQGMAAFEQSRSVWVDKIAAASLQQINDDPQLLEIATAGGKVIFGNNCAPCHGTGATGRPGGYPALVDDDWLWGGTLDDIDTTITHGIRNTTDSNARFSQMPAFGADGILTSAQIAAVADHVLAISGQGPDNAEGAAVFADNCVACHGELGTGDQSVGAPNLTDRIWLYGNTKQAIINQVTKPHQGVMPSWQGRLSDVEIKQAAVYVHSLGGGQ